MSVVAFIQLVPVITDLVTKVIDGIEQLKDLDDDTAADAHEKLIALKAAINDQYDRVQQKLLEASNK
jgi:hypothetical protein